MNQNNINLGGKKESLQTRLIFMLLLMVIIPMVVIGIVAEVKADNLLKAQVIDNKQGEVSRVADRFEQYLLDNAAALTALAQSPSMQEMGSLNQIAALKAFQEGIGSFELMFVVDAQGKIKNTFPHTDFGGKIDFTDRQWYKDVAEQKKTVISDTYISAFTKQATAPIVTPILDGQNRIIGYLGGNISLDNLSSLVQPLNQGQTGRGIILDKKSFYLIDSRDDVRGKEHQACQDEKILQIVKDGQPQVASVDEQVLAFTPIGDSGWSVLSLQDKTEALKSATDLRNLIVLLIIFFTLLAGIVGFFAIGRVIKPVLGLMEAAQAVAGGNLNPPKVEYNRRDEIGQLITAFNAMVQNLHDLVKQVWDTSRLVVSSSEQLAASSEQSAQVANQVAVSITQVAQGADEQVHAVDQTLLVMGKMSTDMQQAAVNANSIDNISQQTSKAAEIGGQAVQTAIVQMNNIEESVTRSAEVISLLGQRSQEIGEIVNTIANIADQTNLLALNAAIEAARAGEQGRGFAVVAEEVRKLAEQSQESTKHIADLISEVQGDTEKAVLVMSEGTGEVKKGTQVAQNAGVAFTQIANLLEDLTGRIRDISLVTQQSAANSEEILSAIKQIDLISRETAGQTQTVSAATQEQLASMEEVASASQSLTQIAQELENAVSKFKI